MRDFNTPISVTDRSSDAPHTQKIDRLSDKNL